MITLNRIVSFNLQLIPTESPIDTGFYCKVYYDEDGAITTMNTEFDVDPAEKFAPELAENLNEKLTAFLSVLVTNIIAFTAPAIHILGRVSTNTEGGSYTLTSVEIENYGVKPLKITV